MVRPRARGTFELGHKTERVRHGFLASSVVGRDALGRFLVLARYGANCCGCKVRDFSREIMSRTPENWIWIWPTFRDQN
jgi:hypothetical protein